MGSAAATASMPNIRGKSLLKDSWVLFKSENPNVLKRIALFAGTNPNMTGPNIPYSQTVGWSLIQSVSGSTLTPSWSTPFATLGVVPGDEISALASLSVPPNTDIWVYVELTQETGHEEFYWSGSGLTPHISRDRIWQKDPSIKYKEVLHGSGFPYDN